MTLVLDSAYYDEEYFDGGKGYHTYDNASHFDFTADTIIRLFNPKSTLEIGCAKGYLVKALRDKGVKAYGIDISDYAISKAPEDVQDFLFQYDVTSGKPVQFPKVDLIVSFDTFEHIPEVKLDIVKLFMLTHADNWYVRVGTLRTPDWQHDDSHITMHRIEWWQEWFEDVTWEESI